MWGYQRHMNISFQVSAEQVFKKIDWRLDPKVFFLGILVDNRDDRHPICLEPEDCGFSTFQFSYVKSLAAELSSTDQDGSIRHSHPLAQDRYEQRIAERGYIDAIKRILKQSDFEDEIDYHVASPVYLEGFLIFTVLSLSSLAIKEHYSLVKNKYDRFPIFRSLTEAVIASFLNACSFELKDPNRGFAEVMKRADELLRDAGRQFMYTIATAGGNFDGLHRFYDACNEIASLRYEGAIGLGSILIAPRDHKNIKLTLELDRPIKMTDFRMVRKFLEVSDNSSAIVSDSALIYGLGEIRGKYNPKDENLFTVNFTNHFTWLVLHDNNPLMEVEYRQPKLPSDKIDREKLYSDFRRIFKGISKKQLDDLWEVAMEACGQKHGTMIVISDEAKTEADRLGKQGFSVKPIKLTESMVRKVTSIDGAVLLDRDANCHAIGVILDGLATEKGDPSRGARYNSAIRYYEKFKDAGALAILIVSEDGMINVLPDLIPQIKHSKIEYAIDDFKKILEETTLDKKAFNMSMHFFNSIRFYLRQDECDMINDTRKEIEVKFETDLKMAHIVCDDFVPNAKMNDTYYMD
ncbi:diadenylate cyclase [Pedobacter soli]